MKRLAEIGELGCCATTKSVRRPTNAVDTAGLGMTTDATPRTSDPWLTGPQMAEHLQISLRHLIRLRESGVPHVKLGTAIRYSAAEVEEYLRNHRRLSAGQETEDAVHE